MNYSDILDFWFHSDTQAYWLAKNDDFDELIHQKFQELHHQAAQPHLSSRRKSAEARLAEVIVLDQFSRNLFRDQAQAFAQDALALALAQQAIDLGVDQQLSPEQRAFLYMPFMHSESKLIHEFGLKLFQQLGQPIGLDYEKKHKVIIDRFGRYPHRNQILARTSTAEELEFLTQPNSRF